MKQEITKVLILNLDGVPDKSGDFLDHTSVVRCDRQDVPIMINDLMVGIAKPVFATGQAITKQVFVNLTFFDPIPNHFLLLRPCFAGKCGKRMANHIQECTLTRVDLYTDNADNRIPALGAYLGMAAKERYLNECRCERLMNGHEPDCGWKSGKN